MKRVPLIVTILCAIVIAFIGCQKDPIEFGNVGVLNIGLQRDCKTMNKGAIESFDARVTIFYSTEDTVAYNCRFADMDGDGRYINDPMELDCIYVRREVGFWVGVWAVIQGDTVTGMSDPTELLYLSDENPVMDVTIVLEAGYPRIVMSTSTEIAGEDFIIYGEVLEGGEQLEEYAFAIRRGQLGDDEKRIWAKRYLTDSDMEELFSYSDYEFYDAEIFDNDAKRFGCALEMMDFDSVEYSVVAIALLRMNEGDSIQRAIHSPVVSMTISGGGSFYSQPTGYMNGYGYVDLGLPSGTLWAYSNVGANSPTEYGNYYAWGETSTKETYDWTTYQYCNGSETTLTKYCFDESYGLDGYTDSITTLENDDDAASVNWGVGWRMPTDTEMEELYDNCTKTRIEQDGKLVYKLTGPNGNSVVFPAAGYREEGNLELPGTLGLYWSSSVLQSEPDYATTIYVDYDDDFGMDPKQRCKGLSVRPVCVQSKKKRK